MACFYPHSINPVLSANRYYKRPSSEVIRMQNIKLQCQAKAYLLNVILLIPCMP